MPSTERYRLNGRVAIVTGSSKGLGAAIVKTLAAAGAKVVVNASNDVSRAERVAEEIRSQGGEAIAIGANVIDPAETERLVQSASEQLGPVDILVLNATPAQPLKPIEDYDLAFYRQMLDFFIISPYLLTRAALPRMKARGWGRIINVTSEVFYTCVPNFSAYVAAKGGQTGWTRSMSRELAPFGITVNNVAPGWIPVERHADDPEEMKREYLAQIPAGRWGTPQDVADAVAYFASEEAAFVNGQTLCVNGAHTPL